MRATRLRPFPALAAASRLAASIVAAAIIALSGWAFVPRIWRAQAPSASDGAGVPPIRIFRCAAMPVSLGLDAIGQVQPGAKSVIAAPYDGYVAEKRFDFGDVVRKGDELFRLDGGEMEGKVRDAEAALLKAAMAADALARWNDGPDVARARRASATADSASRAAERQVRDAKALFDKGIISRNEVESLSQQAASQADLAASSRLDLQAAMERGGPVSRRMAELDLANARARLDDLRSDAARRIVVAPRDGLALRPPASDKGISPSLDAGSRVAKGQPVLMLASIDAIDIDAQVDEVDVNRIGIGQAVSIESDSFPGPALEGRVSRISMEAAPGAGPGTPSKFDVTVAMKIPKGRRDLRMGMSARLNITTYSNARAIVVPHAAVSMRDGATWVRKSEGGTSAYADVRIETGISTPQGVEVTSGLNEGDTLAY